MRNNRNKKFDNFGDLILSRKSPTQADVGEVFMDRNTGFLPVLKRGINEFFRFASQTVVDALTQRVYLLEQNVGPGYTETVLYFTPEQIEDMLTNSLELLPSTYGDDYTEIQKIVFEYIAGDQAWGYTGNYWDIYVTQGGEVHAQISSNIFSGDSSAIVFYPYGATVSEGGYNYVSPIVKGQGWKMHAVTDGTLTQGNGTFKVKIYHRTVAFEL